MGKIKLTAPPKKKNRYSQFRDWLCENFYKNLCAYCLLSQTSSGALDIDHYEPLEMSPKKENDPKNLLPACKACNGRAGKSDYHPKHNKKTKYKNEKFQVMDIRRDDFEKLFTLTSKGELTPKRGVGSQKAIKNILLFKLDLYNEVRKEYLDSLLTLKELEADMKRSRDSRAQIYYQRILPFVLSRELFYHAFGYRLPRGAIRKRRVSKRALCLPN